MDEQEKITSTAIFQTWTLTDFLWKILKVVNFLDKYLAAIKAPLSGNSVITS